MTYDTNGQVAKFKLWDLSRGHVMAQIQGGQNLHLVLSPDGHTFLKTSDGVPAELCDVEKGVMIRRLIEGVHQADKEWPVARSYAPDLAAFSPDGRTLVTGDKYIRLWEVSSGKELRKWEYRYGVGAVSSVAFSPDGRAILTTGMDWSARLLDVVTGNEIGRFEHESKVISFAVSPDGQTSLTAVETDMDARLWEIRDGKWVMTRRLEGRLEAIRFAQVAGTGNVILTDTFDPALRIWDLGLGRDVDQGASRPDFKPNYATRKEKTATLWGGGDHGAVVQRKYQGKVIQLLDDNKTALIRKEERKVLGSFGYGPYYSDHFAGYDLYDLSTGEHTLRYNLSGKTRDVLVSADGRRVVTVEPDAVYVWVTSTGELVCPLPDNSMRHLSISSDARRLLMCPGVWASGDAKPAGFDMCCLWDTDSAKVIWPPTGEDQPFLSGQLSPDGRRVLKHRGGHRVLTDVETRKEVGLCTDRMVDSATFCPDPNSTLILCRGPDRQTTNGEVWLCDAGTGRQVEPFGSKWGVTLAIFSPDGRTVLTAGWDGIARLWDSRTGQQVQQFVHKSEVTLATFSPDGCTLLTAGSDRVARLWDVGSGKEVCQLTSSFDGSWVVTDPEGRFDTSSLDDIRGLQWVFPDDPLRPLPPETFLRDYYEPRLLQRLLDPAERARMPRIRSVADLNRVQPTVDKPTIQPGDRSEVVRVTVSVRREEASFSQGGEKPVRKTDVYNARLFRDGQLVARWPEIADDKDIEPDPSSPDQMDAWRNLNRVPLMADGSACLTAEVRLPHRATPGPVILTAYAFNEDRVKSTTATATYQALANPMTNKPRAYLIAMGVSVCQNRTWNLDFAAADACLILDALGRALEKSGRYDVVRVPLISERMAGGHLDATKANLRTALDLIAGHPVAPVVRAGIPGDDRLRTATPDDLVIVSFSGHGYTDPRGTFYLVPYDVGGDQINITTALPNCVSSAELSAWLRPVDAGSLVLVVDACHSAAAIQQAGFKPGPLGSRGLGQLAYDKGMSVLAASQAEAVALESRAIRQGLLTYALVKDGLEHRRAEKNGKLTLGGLLSYAAERVPSLYLEVRAGTVRDASGRAAQDVVVVRELTPPSKSLPDRAAGERQVVPMGDGADAVQRPELFDYARNTQDPIFSAR